MSSKSAEFPKAEQALIEYADIETQLSDASVHEDQNKARKLGRRYAALGQIVNAYRQYRQLVDDLTATKELAQVDDSFQSEIAPLEEKISDAKNALEEVLIERDEDDSKDVIMEIKAGAGGEESALFAGDLLRMYLKFADSKGWKTQIMDEAPTDIGGYKDITLAIRNPDTTIAPQDGVWANLKFEGGVHRVQRVPVTESQGRVHTSATGVYVYPESDDDGDEIEIDMNDVRVDVFRAGGPGGQSVNTTDSAVRLTHVPTGIVVSMQNEKSQIQNRAAALRVLKSRLLAAKKEEEESKNSDMRLSQVRTADRSERIRTYNFPENRIADHRTGFKAYNLDQVMDGLLQPVIDSCIETDRAAKMQEK